MFDFHAMRQTLTAQADQWAEMLSTDKGGARTTLRGDTAIVAGTKELQRIEREMDRLDVLEKVAEMTDDIEVARAQSAMAAMAGSHGPAQQWLRLASELEAERDKRLEEERRKAEAVDDPVVHMLEMLDQLGKLVQVVPSVRSFLLSAAQQAIGENQEVAHLRPPPLRVVAAEET